MNYYVANVSQENLTKLVDFSDNFLTKDDTLYILSSNNVISEKLKNLFEDKFNCKVEYCCSMQYIKDTAFDIPISLHCIYEPLTFDTANFSVDDFEIQLCGINTEDTFYKYPNFFDVSLSVWQKPVTIEQVLCKRFGHCVNPYMGYLDYIRTYANAYKSFLDNIEDLQ